MKANSRKVIAVIVVAALLAGAAAAFSIAWLNRPENLTSFIEGRVRTFLKTDVTVERASIALVGGEIELTLRNVNAGKPDNLYVKTEHLVLRFSPWYMLIGTLKVSSISAAGSDAHIPLDILSGKGPFRKFTIPHFDVERTTLRLIGKKSRLNFENIQGYFRENELNVAMHALGGDACMTATLAGSAWEGKVLLSHLDLRDINPDMSGSTEVDVSFSAGGRENYLTIQAEGNNILLPWYKKEMAQVRFAVKASGSGDTFSIDSLALSSPVIELTGTGLISGLDTLDEIGNAAIALDCKSREFDYEELIRALPTDAMPDWLSLLLTHQIRGGQSRFTSLGYHGRMRDFAAGNTYYMNISAALELKDMSFGSGFSRERVRNVSGTGTYSNGTLEFKNLHGFTGASELKSVTLLFEHIEAPGIYFSIDAGFDMALADFLETWKAVMVDEEVAHAFNIISSVRSGRIRGYFKSYTVDPSDEPTDVQGDLTLDNCNFALGDKSVEQLSGTLVKKSFSSPLLVELSGALDTMKVKRLALTFDDLFGDATYSFEAETNDLPVGESFRLTEGASLTINGEGKGTSVEGEVKLTTPGFEIFGTPYRPEKGPITGRSRVKGSIWPGIDLSVPELDISVPPGDVKVVSTITDKKGRSHISGVLNLKRFQAYTKEGFRNLDGTISGDVTVTWDGAASLSGTVVCKDALLFHDNTGMTVNGTIGVSEKTITTDKLDIRYGTTPLVLSGRLTTGELPLFEGHVTVDGLSLERGTSDAIDLPDTLHARAGLTFTNLKLYGIDVTTADATAVLENRTLRLEDIALVVPAGTVTGSALVEEGKAATFDVSIAIKNGRTRTYMAFLSPGTSSLKGLFTFEGHLWGTADSINGDLSFSSTDGRIMKYTTISRIFSVLNIYKIIKTGELDLKSGFPYNRMSSHFTVREGIIRFDDFHLDSNSLQLSAAGTYSLKDNTIDAMLGVQPLEVLDRTISAIPLVGWIITGKDGKLVVVSLKMSGNFDDPKVVPVPIESIKPAGDIIFRTLNLPVDIINNIQKMIQKDKEKKAQ
ncbi:MAG: AsmA-like C-terminal domain-containing protein [Deltaproteobacteria bacterium]|nr:AsmA-like C-terminal domain-containing protein [Deltaproteobacteria bacterium]